jgi:hypothetical protein
MDHRKANPAITHCGMAHKTMNPRKIHDDATDQQIEAAKNQQSNY